MLCYSVDIFRFHEKVAKTCVGYNPPVTAIAVPASLAAKRPPFVRYADISPA